jgi:uncharacterized protein YecT (DUF1311 family)
MSRELKIEKTSGGRLMLFVAIGFGLTIALSNFSAQASGASEAKSGQTQMQLNKEACEDYKKANLEMNHAYQTILRDYNSDRTFIAALRKAQLAWIRYRDAHVESIFPGDASEYGSINPMCRCMQLATITRERTRILNQWVEGLEEGDVCAGSVKTK